VKWLEVVKSEPVEAQKWLLSAVLEKRKKGVEKGGVGEPGKTVSKRVKVSSAQLAVWGGDVPVTASP